MNQQDAEIVRYLRQHAEGEPEIVIDLPTISEQDTDHRVDEDNPELTELAKVILNCTQCQLSKTRQNVVFGVGNPHARLLFIGEAPGADEDRQGEPFVGRAGQLLNKILAAMNIGREDVYIANILKCRPPDNRDPNPEEVKLCLPFLQEQIRLIEPDIIVALGRVAAIRLLNLKSTVFLKDLRGRFFNYSDIPMIVTYHPAALLRSEKYKKPTWDDMKTVMKFLSGELIWDPISGVQ